MKLLFSLIVCALLAVVCDAYDRFLTEDELTTAVDLYLDTSDGAGVQHVLDTYGPIEEWDVSYIRNFGNLFNKERNPLAEFFQADLSMWQLDSAEYMHDMFLGAAAFDSDVSGWTVGNVKHFNGLFYGATSFRGIGLETWDTSSGKYFMVMFADTQALIADLDIRHWDMTSATKLIGMFRDSNYGGNSNFNGLCGWANQMRSDANTRAMFMRSQCPQTSDPALADIETGIDFCIRCLPASDSPTSSPTFSPMTATPSSKPNILFIMTDQQRFDTIHRVQQELPQYRDALKINTPNLDKLSSQGAYFRNAYCQCAVCGPARTSLRTGCTIERTGVQHNELIHEYVNSELFTERVQNLVGLDHILQEAGYTVEYYGKWHLPDVLYKDREDETSVIQYNDYDYGSKEFYFRYDSNGRKLRRHLEHFEDRGYINKDLDEWEQIDTFTKFPYLPNKIDSRYGYEAGTELTTRDGAFSNAETTQPNIVGRYKLSANYTPSFFNFDVAFKALDRLLTEQETNDDDDDKTPFFLTVSFHNPHPPMVPAWEHLEYYWNNRYDLLVPPSINDTMANADYGRASRTMPRYADPEAVREWTATYYALIEEIDEYVGALLDRLGDAINNTLIVFTSDHGEMLGAHGSREKNNFYEESSRIPLFIVFPDKIESNTVVDELVSHIDIFATILDYVDLSEHDDSDGRTLRPFMEGQIYNQEFDEDVIVSEWDYRKPLLSNHDVLDRRIDDRPCLLVRKGHFKLMMHKIASSPEIDMMYDLQNDPFEINNLLGSNADEATVDTLSKAEHLRCLLLDWMKRLDGEKRYYSDPLANYGEGAGDIEEVRIRQSWPESDFWVGDTTIQLGRLAFDHDDTQRWVRKEYLYFGTRTSGSVDISSIDVIGTHRNFISIDTTSSSSSSSSLVLEEKICYSIQITFSSPNPDTFATTSLDAALVFNRASGESTMVPIIFADSS